MFETLQDMFLKGFLLLGIFTLLAFRCAMRNPRASGGIAKGILGWLFRK
jgi:hypothetical protein